MGILAFAKIRALQPFEWSLNKDYSVGDSILGSPLFWGNY